MGDTKTVQIHVQPSQGLPAENSSPFGGREGGDSDAGERLGGLPSLPGPGWGQQAGAPKNISGLEAGSSATAPEINQRPHVPPTAL